MASPADAVEECKSASDMVQSCWPDRISVLVQDVPDLFVWNSNHASFHNVGSVDIHLFRGESQEWVNSWLGIANSQSQIAITADDVWWPVQTSFPSGQNLSWPFYFLLGPAGASLANLPPQAVFSVLQTAAPATLRDQTPTPTIALLSSSGDSTPSNPNDNPSAFAATLEITATRNGATSSFESTALPTALVLTTIAGSVRTIPIFSGGFTSPVQGADLPTLAPFASSTDAPATLSSSIGANLQNSSHKAAALPHWAVALISILGALLLLTLLSVATLLLLLHRKKQRMVPTSPVHPMPSPQRATPSFPRHIALPISPEPEMAALLGRHSHDQSNSSQGRSSSRLSAPNISPEEANAIATAFRDTLRQPPPIEEGDDVSSHHSSASEQDGGGQRNVRESVLNPFERQAGEIMEAQLADDGQSVGFVGSKKPRLVV